MKNIEEIKKILENQSKYIKDLECALKQRDDYIDYLESEIDNENFFLDQNTDEGLNELSTILFNSHNVNIFSNLKNNEGLISKGKRDE